MGELIMADDGLLAEADVGKWVKEKHQHLVSYLKLHAHPRARFLKRGGSGATYIDVFCGPGRARIKSTGEFIEGSAIAAWNASVAQKAPFSKIYTADKDAQRREACAARLRRLGAPVIEVDGDAETATKNIVRQLDPYGFHFAFVDPYNLGTLRLSILQELMKLQRMDILVHISAMDLFRNLDFNLAGTRKEFDDFAPGWLDEVNLRLPADEQRRALLMYWKSLIDAAGFDATADMQPIRNSQNRDLYWLLVVSRHPLAKKFWNIVLKADDPQRGFDI